MTDGLVTLYTHNILESGTVTVTGTPDTGYPVARLYDRSAALYWKITTGDVFEIGPMGGDTYKIGGMGGDTYEIGPTGAGAGQDIYFTVQQAAGSPKSVDTLYIAGHNFGGSSMRWQHSKEGSEWFDAVTAWVQGDDSPIVKSLSTALLRGFWRVIVYGIANPTCGEIMMSLARVFRVDANPLPVDQPSSNVEWSRSVGGLERSVKLGDAMDGLDYNLRLRGASEKAAFKAAMNDLDEYSLPMLVQDIDDNYRLMRLLNDPALSDDPPVKTLTQLSLMEVF